MMDIYLGQIFGSKEAAQTALKHHLLKRNTQYVVAESSPTTWVVKCKLHARYDCKWMVRVGRKTIGAFWKVRKVCNIHTCTNDYQQGGHRQLDVNIISDSLRTMVMSDPTVTVSIVQAHCLDKFQYPISYRKAWYRRQRAVEKVYGNWEDSYATCQSLLFTITNRDPSTVVQWKVWRLRHYVSNYNSKHKNSENEGFTQICRLGYEMQMHHFQNAVQNFIQLDRDLNLRS
ncbi:hypothetical protein LINPERPRIM_LOCUS232 [Linum perenne]